jgi:hypothetical protein
MAALGGMVLEHLVDRLFTPERSEIILKSYSDRSDEADAARRNQLAQARCALMTKAQGRISHLLEMVERGLIEANDPTLKESPRLG